MHGYYGALEIIDAKMTQRDTDTLLRCIFTDHRRNLFPIRKLSFVDWQVTDYDPAQKDQIKYLTEANDESIREQFQDVTVIELFTDKKDLPPNLEERLFDLISLCL